jgi:hypothetical protein
MERGFCEAAFKIFLNIACAGKTGYNFAAMSLASLKRTDVRKISTAEIFPLIRYKRRRSRAAQKSRGVQTATVN